MGKFSRYGNDLYGGTRSFDFVGRRGLWYSITAVVVLAALAVIFVKGMNFGVEFTGGTQVRASMPAAEVTQDNADAIRDVIADEGLEDVDSPTVTTEGTSAIVVEVGEVSDETSDRIGELIQETVPETTDLSQTEIGASWGREVAQQALTGVAVFLVLVMLFIWGYFREWKMSIAAMIALIHDIVITIGIYALSGFPVTPSAVTGLLAILGFSLYDTVVVFDKIRENTHELRKSGQTYGEAANLAVNQTLVRSINTGIVALIPIGAILYVSAVQLGASSLQDLALAQFVGMAVGIYSSVLLAPRVLVHLKGRESAIQLSDKRARSRAKANADRYASVPAFVEDMPVQDEPDLELEDGLDDDAPVTRPTAPSRVDEASGRGRVVPPAKGEVRASGASGRVQPTRQTRSKRGLK
ncbi:protein translocase subunit SecF [Nocardioides sp. W7]|uniref:protein translocase subunit SecF n=1 Tax=Nocardioides sp. W7 TaxID=2931390 RepID=UPI001FD43164|nr:protein translocase subunit SecF [Nocardioides sp. W7]